MGQKALRSTRLELVPLAEEHLPYEIELDSDPEVLRYLWPRRRQWRQGYAREGSRELIRHGFEDLGLRRIFAQTMATNGPSRAMLRSIGMRYVRAFVEEPGGDEPPGHELGEVEYEIRRADWSEGRR